jgi:hypothetical protein
MATTSCSAGARLLVAAVARFLPLDPERFLIRPLRYRDTKTRSATSRR